MKTSMGLIDKLSGEKVILEIPQPDGSLKKVKVSQKWLDKMESEGKMKEIGVQVKVHMLANQKYEIEEWVVGRDIDHSIYEKFKDGSGDMYGMRLFEDGKLQTYFISKEKWVEAKHQLGV